jgi:hypothetical protein
MKFVEGRKWAAEDSKKKKEIINLRLNLSIQRGGVTR